MRVLLISVILTGLVGCAYPASELRVPDDRPSLAIRGAPHDAILYVDGLAMGAAQQYNGKESALLLEPGTHKIEVLSKGKTLLQEKIFLGGGEQKTLSIQGVAP